MKSHVAVVSAIRIVFGTIGLISSILLAFFFDYIKDFIPIHDEFMENIYLFLMAMFKFLIVFSLLFSLAGLIGGIALLANKNWGRILTLVVSAVSLINIPLGTLLGAYSIWVLMQDDTIKMCRPAP